MAIYSNILSPAKINLILKVGKRSSDGFHSIKTLMAPLKWGDRISVTIEETSQTDIQVKMGGAHIPLHHNLVFKAAQLFTKYFKIPLHVSVHLKKNIPLGSGLGGGSSNAAMVLLCLHDWLQKKKRKKYFKEIFKLAEQLGSDVPFFLLRQSAWCEGRGEVCKPVFIPSWPLLLLLSSKSISTPWAYQQMDQKKLWSTLGQRPHWLDHPFYFIPRLENDFETIVLSAHPSLNREKQALIESGAVAVSMSGSGATFFGIYETGKKAQVAQSFLIQKGFRTIPTLIS